jgi:AcrR family transcriptional regulator
LTVHGEPDDRRTRILDASERLFAESGFDATPTGRIADLAEVPKGLVFYYFPQKIELLKALLNERLPHHPLCDADEVAVPGNPVRSLLRLAKRLALGEHESQVLRTIISARAARTRRSASMCGRCAKACST